MPVSSGERSRKSVTGFFVQLIIAVDIKRTNSTFFVIQFRPYFGFNSFFTKNQRDIPAPVAGSLGCLRPHFKLQADPGTVAGKAAFYYFY
jgi:hypothetical protein